MQAKIRLMTLVLASAAWLVVQNTNAQDKLPKSAFQFALPGLNVPQQETVSVTAEFEVGSSPQTGTLRVSATIEGKYHLYSTTQKPGGPSPTRIRVKTDGVKVTGPFVPNPAPMVTQNSVWPGLDIEEHHEHVTWSAPIESSAGPLSDKHELNVDFDALVCSDGNCSPFHKSIVAKLAGSSGVRKQPKSNSTAASSPTPSGYRAPNTHGEFSAWINPNAIAPGGKTKLTIQFVPDAGYHVYPYVAGDPEDINRTLIVATEKSGLKFSAPTTTTKITTREEAGIRIDYHEGKVEWEIEVSAPTTASQGPLPIEFLVGYTTCDKSSCDRPSAVKFKGTVSISSSGDEGNLAGLTSSAESFKNVGNHPALVSWFDKDLAESALAVHQDSTAPPAANTSTDSTTNSAAGVGPSAAQSLTMWHLVAALIGGFLLNLMPCVLPVIGLKIMSFVDQSGNDHRRVIMLNLAFVFGLLSVLWLLAAVTILAKLLFGTAFGWGEQFTLLEFKVSVAALLFAMALSFLGVWEIPIPGFATGSQSGKLMEREGFAGAFIKGILTTILATPCSGPLLGTLFGLSLSQSPLEVLLLYSAVGLGMSAPYLVLCVFPGMTKMLPKPGAWMETLKQVMAFPLLFTVVFFIASIGNDYRIATLTLLMVVWFACWLIGRIPAYAEPHRIRTGWAIGVATIALGAVGSFQLFGPVHHDVPWQPYNEAQLTSLRKQGKTVMIDFTANWCATCQINTLVAVDRPKVAELVAKNGVVAMLADWSDHSDEIRDKLTELNSNSIPLLAIYPPDPTAGPIILPDLLSESQVLSALNRAGPSRTTGVFSTSRLDSQVNPRGLVHGFETSR